MGGDNPAQKTLKTLKVVSSMKVSRLTGTEGNMRNPQIVMAPQRLGAMHPNRISFVRTLIRKMVQNKWQVTKHDWQLSAQGFGHVIYKLATPHHIYHLVIFCNDIKDEDRNDRVIAEKWDVTFALVQGEVTDHSLAQLRANVPLQEAGRNPSNVVVLARANKSVRMFEHIVSHLAQGEQPNPEELVKVGYILRTTAVYGNGKFGIADFELLENNPDFNQAFSAQMCAVYLLRQFSLDWIDYLAKQQGGENACCLNRDLQRYLGVGNATGLGMAPYLINHPCVVDQWMSNREAALAAVLDCPAQVDKYEQLKFLINKAIGHLQQIDTLDPTQKELNQSAIIELQDLENQLHHLISQSTTWRDLLAASSQLTLEAEEILLSCLMEICPDVVDVFQDQMNSTNTLSLEKGKKVHDLLQTLESQYRWAIETDFSKAENTYWFWYRSQDKEEPRLGIRGEEHGEDRELPLDIGRQVYQLHNALLTCSPDMSLAEFLVQKPQYRTITRRVWTLGHKAMGDIQMNVLHKQALPIHLLRCKLALLGATKFDPRSDRWVRVSFFQGAPLLDEIHDGEWLFPLLPKQSSTTSLLQREFK